jgi:uncharacterized protein YkwD
LNRFTGNRLWRLMVLLGGISATLTSRADAVSAVQVLRAGGCGGIMPAAQPLRHIVSLDRAAEQWAAGRSPVTAAQRSGYPAQSTSALHVRGPDSSLVEALRRSSCRTLTDRGLSDIGVYQRGSDTWLILASPYVVPAPAQAPVLASRTLELVNEVRARGARCGARSFQPAPPVRFSGTLESVALGHAADMARHNYFEHQDLQGRSPADRVRAVGYREKLVGENIAYGPKSAEEVVQGWLNSPGHCENIMDPRFAEMGIAYAPGRASRRGLYWVQLLADPLT